MISSVYFPPLSYIREIRIAVENNACFHLNTREHVIKRMSLLEEIKCFYRPKSYRFFLLGNIQLFNIYLKKLSLIDSDRDQIETENLKKEIFRTARALIRKSQENGIINDSKVEKCRLYLTAAQTGISYKILQQQTEFLSFARKNHLGLFIETFCHRVKLIQGDICILSAESGDFIPWYKLKSAGILNEQDKLLGSYGYYGVSTRDQRNWVQLPVFKKEDPASWNYTYRLELCTRIGNEPRGLGDHAWLRIKTPKGYVYSVGFTSEKESINTFNLLNVRHAFLTAPDYAEFSDENFSVISSEISKKEFDELTQMIESKKNTKNLKFQLMQSNCFLYALNIFNYFSKNKIHISGYSYPILIYYVLKQRIKKKCSHQLSNLSSRIISISQPYLKNCFDYLSFIPGINYLKISITKISSPLVSFWLNLLIILLGGSKVDPSLPSLKTARPYICFWNEIFNIKKSIFFHPFELKKKGFLNDCK